MSIKSNNIIDDQAVEIRRKLISTINELNGQFNADSIQIHSELENEISELGTNTLIDHLRLCGNIPESFGHDSSVEKLYSKYTDSLLCHAYKAIGLNSIVLSARANVADVEAFAQNYSFVADAKAFRLSRTAKNQKDFKVQAMDGWKHGKPYAMVVCPIYQLPKSSSQIYQQATTRNVCIFTFSHLSLLVAYAEQAGHLAAEGLLHKIFQIVERLNPSNSASEYWTTLNQTILSEPGLSKSLWVNEKLAAAESVEIAKKEALEYLAAERERIMNMSQTEAVQELITASKIESKIKTIANVKDSGLFNLE